MKTQPSVGLFVTCLADLYRPTVAFAAVKLLEDCGCAVAVPAAQTCCGQPAYNSGDKADARAIAASVVEAFERFDHVVAPSGSCAAMIARHYPSLLAGTEWHDRATRLAAKTHELVAFLTRVMKVEKVEAAFDGAVTYHDSCSGLRELGIHDEPRRLLASVDGLRLEEMDEPEACCGFGGTFCVKYPDISNAIATRKTASIARTGATTVLSGDLGCLLNIAGRLKRERSPVAARHIAEILAGMASGPAIGEPDRD